MEQGSRYGPPIERHLDGTLYQMSPSQQKQAAKLIKKYCCNCDKGNCILLDDGDGCVCPQRISYSVCCRWFRNAVLPAFPELEADIFKDVSLRRCVSCGTRYVPGSNRSRFCPACAVQRRRQKDRERKQKTREPLNKCARADCEEICVRKRRKSTGILTDFKLLQRIYGGNLPQDAAAVFIQRFPMHTVRIYGLKKHDISTEIQGMTGVHG